MGLGDWEVLMLRALRGVIDGKLGMDEEKEMRKGGSGEKKNGKEEEEEELEKKKGKEKKKEKRQREDSDSDDDYLDNPSKKSKR